MHIHYATSFGFNNVYPDLVKTKDTYITGQQYIGNKGLLEYFEMHLGIPSKERGEVFRINKYQEAAQHALSIHPNLYFKQSFEVDPWNTTKELLGWSDHLQLTFWNFQCDNPDLHRLYALSCIAPHCNAVPIGVNQRWVKVYHALKDGSITLPLQHLTIYDHKEYLHPFYKNLFECLRQKGTTVRYQSPHYPDIKEPKTDLETFQKRLIEGGKQAKIEAKGDGTLIIIKASNDFLLADGLAAYLSEGQIKHQPLMVLPKRGSLIENALIKYGMPAMGYTEELEDGAFDQLVSLMTLFLWDPFDSDKLIQYLTIPNAPVHKKLRFKLAGAYAQESGIENPLWNKVINEFISEEGRKSLEQYQQWFNRERYAIAKGAPSEKVIQLYKDLAYWALRYSNSLEETDDARKKPLEQLYQKCKVIQELCKGKTTILANELNHWIRELKSISSNQLNPENLGAYQHVPHSANVVDHAPFTIWWNFVDPGNPLKGFFIPSAKETQTIGEEYFHKVPDRLEEWYQGQIKSIAHCTESLILCIPEQLSGEQVSPHPLYADLQAVFSNTNKLIHLLNPNGKLDFAPVFNFEKKPLPHNQPYWISKAPVALEFKEKQSYTSLAKLLTSPYAYLMDYELGIKPRSIPELKINHQLKGNVLHRAAEELWKIKDLLQKNETEIKNLILKGMDIAYKELGQVFLLPKNAIYKAELDNIGDKSLFNLLSIIKANHWEVVEYENWHDKIVDDIELVGYIDLVLKRNDEIAILDLKYSGRSTRQKEIAERRAIQLLIYQLIYPNFDAAKIHLGYYILESSQLFMQNEGAFEEAIVPPQTENRSMEQLWTSVKEAYHFRMNEIKDCRIEAGDGLPQSEFAFWEQYDDLLLESGKKGPNKEKPGDKYGPYKTLLGK